MLPVLTDLSPLPPSLLADWTQYRLRLESGPRAPGLQFKVANSMFRPAQILQLFVFFEERGAGRGYVVGENKHWSDHMTLLRALRNNLTSVLTVHSEKMCSAVHSALDKIICNYTHYAEVSILCTRSSRARNTLDHLLSKKLKWPLKSHFTCMKYTVV